MKSAYIKFILIVLWLVWFDQITKYLFYDKEFFNNFLLISKVFNNWVAFWIDLNIYIILIISFMSILFFIFLQHRKYISNWVLIMLISWTIWNLLDRILLLWVRDFIDLQYWPVFNFADTYLTFAVLILIYEEFFKKSLEAK